MKKYVKIGKFNEYEDNIKIVYWCSPKSKRLIQQGCIAKTFCVFKKKYEYQIFFTNSYGKIFISRHESLKEAAKKSKKVFGDTNLLEECINATMRIVISDIKNQKYGNK